MTAASLQRSVRPGRLPSRIGVQGQRASNRPLAAAIVAAVLGLLALAPPPAARAADVVGIADQGARMFSDPFFAALDVRVSRLIVSYDAVLRRTFEVADVEAWLTAAEQAGVEPLIAFNHSRGCYDGRGVVRRSSCRLPSVERYVQAVEAFRRRFPQARVLTAWNEANHRSQPTARNPRRAAAFYNALRSRCPGCRVVAADVLDQAGVQDWLRTFKRHARGTPGLWGLHNYQDTNNFTSSTTRAVLKLVRGEVWLTETGGIVRFGRRRPFDPERAAEATAYMFRLAASSPRITRLYIYQWSGVARSERFDAGLMTPAGRPRPAYYVVRRRLARPGGNPGPRTALPACAPGLTQPCAG